MSETDALATQWRSISHLLDAALLLPASERGRWLNDLPAEQMHLRETLRHFLELHARVDGEGFLESPAIATVDNPDATAMLSPGETVGPYRVIKELGSGGMGSVWLAERVDGKPRRRVALKLPRMVWASDLSERMERERDILASLEHPHIARLYDAGLDDQARPYLAIEYVEGTRITHYCRDQNLDTRRRVELFLQVLSAVQYAHTNLVLHRDLKPGNILVTQNGQVRLLDFGIARLVEETQTEGESEMITATRALTPRYASPEQLRADRLTLVSDVYSLGVILHELLTGLSPYPVTAKSRAALEIAVMEGVITPPSRRVASEAGSADLHLSGLRLSRVLRGDLDAIILKSLSADVSGRYASVEAFSADLQRWLDGRPVLAVAPSALMIARKFVLRHRLSVSIATVAILAIVAMSVVALYQAEKAAAESQRAAATRDFLIDMFERANPELHGGREATVRELVVAATENLSNSTSTDPLLATEIYAAVSNIWLKFGDDVNAVKALRERSEIISDAAADGGEVVARLDEARLAAHSRRIDRLRQIMFSATYKSKSIESRSSLADKHWLLGWLSLEEGRLADAEKHFRSSNQFSHQIDDEPRIIRSYYGIALSSIHAVDQNRARQIINRGLEQIRKSRLGDFQKIRRRFELISCLALIGDYKYGWSLMSEVFNEARNAFSTWVPSQVEIYSYMIVWAIRVGDFKSAREVIKSINFAEIPDSLKKAELILSVSRLKMKESSISDARDLAKSALGIYQRLDATQSYKAAAFLAEIASSNESERLLENMLQHSAWVVPIESRHAIEREFLKEWFTGVRNYSRGDFELAEKNFIRALESAEKFGPAGHPREALMQLAVWQTALANGKNDGSSIDPDEVARVSDSLRDRGLLDDGVTDSVRFIQAAIIGVQRKSGVTSHPEWRLSLL